MCCFIIVSGAHCTVDKMSPIQGPPVISAVSADETHQVGVGGGGVKLLDPLWKRNGLHIQLPSVHQHGPAEGGAWPWLPSCHWLGSYMLHYSIFTSMPLMKNLKLLGIQTRRSCLQLLCWGRTGNHCGDMSSMWPSKMNLCLSTGRIQSLFVCYPPPTVWLNVALSGDNWIDGGSG